ncbi:ABC transporter ATP-binding protein (plasmid) [Rhizobium bangladeshense]|uniref:ABC transporter ATP-binding protein n=1 Tax=Rhizobium bangladeshense TaxID=1138189 RepID=UPI001A97D541|nr:ABC transporter ATP-binding protein [Rhizobium bangladeshense]QSY97895.1 ABC transporter ATP-binding protein [Rhizobium bangladeshense]
MSELALEAKNLCKNYGGLRVTKDVTLALEIGARHALIGPNGAGKTTLVGLLSGTIEPSAGTISLLGKDVTALGPAARVKHGLGRTFQVNSLFRELTVFQNVFLAISEHRGISKHLLTSIGRHKDALDEVWRVLEMLGLSSDAARRINEIAYGRQRLVEIAIALVLEPKVLLLDEPAAGIPGAEVPILLNAIDKLDDSIAVLMIEHDMQIVKRFARSVTVLAEGEVIESGPPDSVMSSVRVRTVYLGRSGQQRFGELKHA